MSECGPCLYPDWEGGLSLGEHSWDGDDFCRVCGMKRTTLSPDAPKGRATDEEKQRLFGIGRSRPRGDAP